MTKVYINSGVQKTHEVRNPYKNRVKNTLKTFIEMC